MKITVIGANSFIGIHLVNKLLEQNFEINAIVHSGIPKCFEKIESKINISNGDLVEIESLSDALFDSDMIINLAGIFSDHIEKLYQLNVIGTFNLLEKCLELGKQNVIFISSAAVYGESSGQPLIETDPLNPKTQYGLAKHLAERIYQYYSENHSISAIILRFPNVYGPGNKGVVMNFISSIMQGKPIEIHGNGNQSRDFLYIDDAIDAIIKAINYGCTYRRSNIFNISSGITTGLLDLVSIIEKKAERKAILRYSSPRTSDISRIWLDYKKAESLIGFKPKISLEEGIEKTMYCQKT